MTATALAQFAIEMSASIGVLIILGVLVAYVGGLVLVWKYLEYHGFSGNQILGILFAGFAFSPLLALLLAQVVPPVGNAKFFARIRQHKRLPPPPPPNAPRFVICARCGERSNLRTATSCWNCNQSFLDELAPPAPVPSAFGRPGYGWVVCPDCGCVSSDRVSICEGCKGVLIPGEAHANPPAQSDPTPLIGAEPQGRGPIHLTPAAIELAGRQVKVRCKACGKRYQGSVAQIAKLRACPRCKASPFDSESIS